MLHNDWIMLKITTADRKYVLVEEVLPARERVPVNWYNPLYERFTNIRTVRLLRSLPLEDLEHYLARKGLRIYTVVDNQPLLTPGDHQRVDESLISLQAIQNYQRVKEEGSYYVDEFGLYVYVSHRLGLGEDQDLRYDGVPDGELFTLQYQCHGV